MNFKKSDKRALIMFCCIVYLICDFLITIILKHTIHINEILFKPSLVLYVTI